MSHKGIFKLKAFENVGEALHRSLKRFAFLYKSNFTDVQRFEKLCDQMLFYESYLIALCRMVCEAEKFVTGKIKVW